MIRKISLLTALVLSCSLSSCSSKNKLVDTNKLVDNSNIEAISDTRRNFYGATRVETIDGRFFYSCGNIRVDLGNKIIENDCDVIGCDHRSETCEASPQSRRGLTFIRCSNGGRFYNSDDKIYFKKDGKKELIYQNSYSTEEADEAGQGKVVLNFIPYEDDKFIVGGYNYIYILDTKTNEASQPIDVGEVFTDNIAVVDHDTLAVANSNYELFLIHLDTRSVEKIRDYATSVYTDGSSLYFMDVYQQKNDLLMYDLKTKEETVITKNISFFCLYDKGIIFEKNTVLEENDKENNENDMIIPAELYNTDTNGSEPELIYNLDTEKAGEKGWISGVEYFPGYDKLIVTISPDRHDTYGQDYVLIDPDDWSAEYIVCDIET